MLCSECNKSVHDLSETDTLDSIETCVEISTRQNWLWIEIFLRCRHEISWIFCRLGREHSGMEEHIQLLFHFRIYHGFLVEQETQFCGLEYRRSRVYFIVCGIMRTSLDLKDPCRLIWS
jgi:hypothetical protein